MPGKNNQKKRQRANRKAKQAKVKELFESQQLVQYPADEPNKDKAYQVDPLELRLIQEVNEGADGGQGMAADFDNEIMLAYDALAKLKGKEEALEEVRGMAVGDRSSEQVEAKPQEPLEGMPKMEAEEKKQQPEVAAEEKQGLDDSFEDLEGEYMRTVLQEELEQKQKTLLEEQRAVEEGKHDVKVLIDAESRIVFDDYIANGAKPQVKQSQKPEGPLKLEDDAVAEIDWFHLYVKKSYDFRNDAELYKKVRNAIMVDREISPKSKLYDALKVGSLPNKGANLKGNQGASLDVLQSQIDLGPSQEEQKQMKLQMLKRQTAWCVMLGIDCNSEEFLNFSEIYHQVLQNNQEDSKNQVLKQISLDVSRTFRPFALKFLNAEISTGQNKLYNLLKVYALALDPEIGYTQGMNFIAAMILMHVPNEVLACQIFTKLLAKDNWARMYISSTPKLFDVSQQLQDRLLIEDYELHEHLLDHQILLEVVLAGPLMTLFANTTCFSVTTHIVNCFILDGENYLMGLIMNILKSMRAHLLSLKDQFDLQAYMNKAMFDALDPSKFYEQLDDPPVQDASKVNESNESPKIGQEALVMSDSKHHFLKDNGDNHLPGKENQNPKASLTYSEQHMFTNGEVDAPSGYGQKLANMQNKNDKKYADKLLQMKQAIQDSDFDTNLKTLKKWNGNVQQALNELLSSYQQR